MNRHHVRPTLILALVFAFLAVGPGCGPEPNSLDGSIGEVLDLEFSRVEMRRFSSGTIQLDYLRAIEDTDAFDIVCKVVFDVPSAGITLAEEIDITANNGIIERIVATNDEFPLLDEASITFESGGTEAGPVVGVFGALFENGRTLEGTFDTDLELVEF